MFKAGVSTEVYLKATAVEKLKLIQELSIKEFKLCSFPLLRLVLFQMSDFLQHSTTMNCWGPTADQNLVSSGLNVYSISFVAWLYYNL